MAEAAEHGEAHEGLEAEAGAHGEEHGAKHEAHGGGDSDPMHHIRDVVLWGVDSTSGQVVSMPYEHGHPREIAGVIYQPKMVGPFKLEFTKHMAGLGIAAALFFAISMVVARRVL